MFEWHYACSWCIQTSCCHMLTVDVLGDRCPEQKGNRHFCSSSTTPCIPENPDTACTGTGEKVQWQTRRIHRSGLRCHVYQKVFDCNIIPYDFNTPHVVCMCGICLPNMHTSFCRSVL